MFSLAGSYLDLDGDQLAMGKKEARKMQLCPGKQLGI